MDRVMGRDKDWDWDWNRGDKGDMFGRVGMMDKIDKVDRIGKIGMKDTPSTLAQNHKVSLADTAVEVFGLQSSSALSRKSRANQFWATPNQC